jgi:hypothetical protein
MPAIAIRVRADCCDEYWKDEMNIANIVLNGAKNPCPDVDPTPWILRSAANELDEYRM